MELHALYWPLCLQSHCMHGTVCAVVTALCTVILCTWSCVHCGDNCALPYSNHHSESYMHRHTLHTQCSDIHALSHCWCGAVYTVLTVAHCRCWTVCTVLTAGCTVTLHMHCPVSHMHCHSVHSVLTAECIVTITHGSVCAIVTAVCTVNVHKDLYI